MALGITGYGTEKGITKTALFSEHGFWIPDPFWEDDEELNRWKRTGAFCRRMALRATKALHIRSASERKLQEQPDQQATISPFKIWPQELTIYFLLHLCETGDIDTLRALLIAYPSFKSLVLVLTDEKVAQPGRDILMYNPLDLLLVDNLTSIRIPEFKKLPMDSPLRYRPIRIFVIQQSDIGSSPSVFDLTRSGHSEMAPYLTKSTPLIVRTFGECTHAQTNCVQWCKEADFKVPLIICRDETELRYSRHDFTSCKGPPLMIWNRREKKYFIPFDRKQYNALENTGCKDIYLGPEYDDVQELHNLPDFGNLSPPSSGWCNSDSVVILGFRNGCVSRDGEPCCAPRIKLYHSTGSPLGDKFPFNLLKITFEGPRVPDVELAETSLCFDGALPSRLCLVNKTWTEANPFGVTCKHAAEKGQDASQWCCANPSHQSRIRLARPYGRSSYIRTVELIGLPDGVHDDLFGLQYTRTLIWKRLSPTKPSPLSKVLILDRLRQLDIYSLVRKGEAMPTFNCSRLEILMLIALPGSTASWDLPKLFDYKNMRSLKDIVIAGPQEPKSQMFDWDLRFVAETVEALCLSGCVPRFAMCNDGTPFSSLKVLCIDISQVIDESSSSSVSLTFTEGKFPHLQELVLAISYKYTGRFRAYSWEGIELRIELPPSTTCLAVNAMIPVKDLIINDKSHVFRKPGAPLYTGTVKRWRREMPADPGAQFIYEGERETACSWLNYYHQ